MTEFTCNDFVNKTTGLSPFEIIIGFKLRQPVDLINSHGPHHSRISDSASTFTSHIRALHEEIREKIMKNNTDYKAFADLHRRLRTFNVGDYVMVRMRSERFPLRTVTNYKREAQDHSESSKRLIQTLMWWISHQTLASVAVLMLRTWSHIEALLIPFLIHSWINLLRTLFLRAPHISTSLQNYPM